MSLINEALKKAQRHRSGDPADLLPESALGPVAKRGQPRSAQQLLLLAIGGVALVVLSVVITVWLVNRPPAPKTAAQTASAKAAPATTPPDASAPAPVIVAPVITPPAVAQPPPASPAPVANRPSPATEPVTTASPTIAPTPAVTQAPPSPAPPTAATSPIEPAPPVKTDERVHQFVDNIKVGGIRSSGDDSRVLMNDRVYRVNDIVERSLGVRLTKVESDALTFSDANGALYVKHF